MNIKNLSLTSISQLNSNSKNENHSCSQSTTTGESLQQPEYKLPENKISSSPCSCDSLEVTAVLSSTIHWAEWLCVGCGKHRGWIEHPETVNRREAQDQLIDRLLGVATGWNRTFLEELRRKRKRSPKQLQKLTEIADRYSTLIADGGES